MVTTVSYMLQKKKIPAESESNLCELRCLCCDLYNMQSTVCWPDTKQIVQKTFSALKYLE